MFGCEQGIEVTAGHLTGSMPGAKAEPSVRPDPGVHVRAAVVVGVEDLPHDVTGRRNRGPKVRSVDVLYPGRWDPRRIEGWPGNERVIRG